MSAPTHQLTVPEIFHQELLEYAHDITFPWDLDRPLKATQVGAHFQAFSRDATKWNVPPIKTALKQLADIGLENLRLDDFVEFVRDYAVDGNGRLRFPGVVAILIQGARHVCHGLDQRYLYHYFEPIALHMQRGIIGMGERIELSDWEFAGIDANQAIVRILVVLSPLVNSEESEDHETLMRILERLRPQYEKITHSHDPHHPRLEEDLKDPELLGRMREDGPPQWQGVKMHDYVFWMMRMQIAHVAVVRHFGRDPVRNVAEGREDAKGEAEWLSRQGIERTQEDEELRRKIREDVEAGRWRPLNL